MPLLSKSRKHEKDRAWREKHPDYRKQWLEKKWQALVESYGEKCCVPKCTEVVSVDFAHIRRNGISGWGRGKWSRYNNIVKNPMDYVRLCGQRSTLNHHKQWDDWRELNPEGAFTEWLNTL